VIRADRATPGDAVVVRVSGPTATIVTRDGEQEARLTPRVPGGPAVAGDRVLRRADAEPPGVVEVLPRTSVLERGDGGDKRARPNGANADLLLVVAAVVEPPLRDRLVDRYLVAASLGRLEAALVITKLDLPHDDAALDALLAPYRELGYPTLTGNARTPALAEEVRTLIDGRVAILAGHSGVGKSTLTRTLTGVERAVGAVSAKVRTGRHTTSDPRLIPLPGGGAVVDTAGVRTFHLPRLDRARLEAGFPEIARAGEGCRFRGCAHDGDAGCAVEGAVPARRLESYRRMLAEMR
jgi:ribosome biogenesis GTPase